MPRKPKIKPEQITVVVNGVPISVTLHPPKAQQKAWYVYWAGLGNSKSTGERQLKAAIAVAESMLRNGGERVAPADGVLCDEEFEEIQRHHFSRDQSSDGSMRAAKSLKSCLEAIDAFRRIIKLPAVALATPDDCARFEAEALKLPKSWRLTYPNAKREGSPTLSSNTVAKWSTALAAAFERANVNAGKKCVRGVVPPAKLLKSNPWRQFNPIVGVEKAKRHLSNDELLSILDFLEKEWSRISVATTAVKTCLWSWARLSELAKLSWTDVRPVGQEWHFQIVGKWGIVKWARLPLGLMEELQAIRTGSPFVFSAYNEQLRSFYLRTEQQRIAAQVHAEFSPSAFASWFHERITQWAQATNRPGATAHAFRKTSLQHARRGEDVNRLVAKDAKLSEAVMTGHYTTEEDEELRQASNRTYHRIVLSLSHEVASRYGYRPECKLTDLRNRLSAATAAEDWALVAKLAEELRQKSEPANGEKLPSEAAEEGGVSENI